MPLWGLGTPRHGSPGGPPKGRLWSPIRVCKSLDHSSINLPTSHCNEQCVGIDGNWDTTHMPEGCMSLHPLALQMDPQQRALAQREARLEEAENGPWSSGLVYVGAIGALYVRDGLRMPRCLQDDGEGGCKVGVEVLVLQEVRCSAGFSWSWLTRPIS